MALLCTAFWPTCKYSGHDVPGVETNHQPRNKLSKPVFGMKQSRNVPIENLEYLNSEHLYLLYYAI